MTVLIHEASHLDARRIAEIHVASFRATYRELFAEQDLDTLNVEARAAVWEHRLADDGLVLLATCDGEVRAFAWIGPSVDGDDPTRVGELRSIHVAPSVQGTGIGRALLSAVRQRMRDAGADEATLWVVEDNEHARRVYVRDGWKPDGARRCERLALQGEDGPEVAVLRMRRALSDGQGRR